MKEAKGTKFKSLILLNILLLVYSLEGVCSKTAGGESFPSIRFCIFYGLVLVILGIYAICWQQLIKRLPLTLAYANKAVTLVWGMVWGILFFSEKVTPLKAAGVVITIGGVLLYTFSDRDTQTGAETSEETGFTSGSGTEPILSAERDVTEESLFLSGIESTVAEKKE